MGLLLDGWQRRVIDEGDFGVVSAKYQQKAFSQITSRCAKAEPLPMAFPAALEHLDRSDVTEPAHKHYVEAESKEQYTC